MYKDRERFERIKASMRDRIEKALSRPEAAEAIRASHIAAGVFLEAFSKRPYQSCCPVSTRLLTIGKRSGV